MPQRRDTRAIPISIHALHEESDRGGGYSSPMVFQSTLSMRRATGLAQPIEGNPTISIHALHEESDHVSLDAAYRDHISIHALHEESDAVRIRSSPKLVTFQSTLSMRRATHRTFRLA